MELASLRLGLRKRELRPADTGTVLGATLANLNWVGPRFTEQDVLSTPEFAHYAVVDPDRGDFGVVALDRDTWVGVVWVVFLPPDDPGFGFVSPRIGELSVSVKEGARRSGLGRELMNEAIAIARQRGHEGLSLSVEAGNPARDLYRSVGFVDVDAARLPGTMLLAF